MKLSTTQLAALALLPLTLFLYYRSTTPVKPTYLASHPPIAPTSFSDLLGMYVIATQYRAPNDKTLYPSTEQRIVQSQGRYITEDDLEAAIRQYPLPERLQAIAEDAHPTMHHYIEVNAAGRCFQGGGMIIAHTGVTLDADGVVVSLAWHPSSSRPQKVYTL